MNGASGEDQVELSQAERTDAPRKGGLYYRFDQNRMTADNAGALGRTRLTRMLVIEIGLHGNADCCRLQRLYSDVRLP